MVRCDRCKNIITESRYYRSGEQYDLCDTCKSGWFELKSNFHKQREIDEANFHKESFKKSCDLLDSFVAGE